MDDFLCPILQDVMTDPVIASDGHSYERSAILQWFGQRMVNGHPIKSPLTNEILSSAHIIENTTLRKAIESYEERAEELEEDYNELQEELLHVNSKNNQTVTKLQTFIDDGNARYERTIAIYGALIEEKDRGKMHLFQKLMEQEKEHQNVHDQMLAAIDSLLEKKQGRKRKSVGAAAGSSKTESQELPVGGLRRSKRLKGRPMVKYSDIVARKSESRKLRDSFLIKPRRSIRRGHVSDDDDEDAGGKRKRRRQRMVVDSDSE